MIESVRLSDDLSQVIATARMDRTAGRIMRNDRRYDPASRAADAELSGVEPGFFDRLTETDLYLEYRVL